MLTLRYLNGLNYLDPFSNFLKVETTPFKNKIKNNFTSR